MSSLLVQMKGPELLVQMKGPAFMCVICILPSLPVTISIIPNEIPACSQLVCQTVYLPRKKCDKSYLGTGQFMGGRPF